MPRRSVDDPQQTDFVARLINRLQIGQQVTDLAAVIKRLTTDQQVRNLLAAHFLLEDTRLLIGAKQNCHVFRFNSQLFNEIGYLTNNVLRFRRFIVKYLNPNGRA